MNIQQEVENWVMLLNLCDSPETGEGTLQSLRVARKEGIVTDDMRREIWQRLEPIQQLRLQGKEPWPALEVVILMYHDISPNLKPSRPQS